MITFILLHVFVRAKYLYPVRQTIPAIGGFACQINFNVYIASVAYVATYVKEKTRNSAEQNCCNFL